MAGSVRRGKDLLRWSGGTPADSGTGQIQFQLLDAVQYREGWNNQLWLFGERKYQDKDQIGYRSVAVQVHGFQYYCYLDASGWDNETTQFLVSQLRDQYKTKGGQHKIVHWDMVRLRYFTCFDYEAYEEAYEKGWDVSHPTRPFVRLYLDDPSSVWKLKELCRTAVRDQRNVERQLILRDNWNKWCDEFLQVAGITLQHWIGLEGLVPRQKHNRATTCQEEYDWNWDKTKLHYLPDIQERAFLMASVRARVIAANSSKSRPIAAVADPDAVEDDRLVALCSDLYWVGQDSVVKLRLYVSDQEMPREPDEENVVVIQRNCKNEEELIKIWCTMVLTMFDVDSLLYLDDVAHDILHVMFRTKDRNLSRFRKGKVLVKEDKDQKGKYWFKQPGRLLANVRDYMHKMMIKPSFDSYTLKAAYHHPKIYHGPTFDMDSHAPAMAAFVSDAQNIKECSVEAEVLRYVERDSHLMTHVSAISSVFLLDIGSSITNGQQTRTLNKLKYYWQRDEWVLDPQKHKKPILCMPRTQYNSFPDPPSLPDVPLRDRDAKFDTWFKEACERYPLDPNTPIGRHLKEPPDPDTMPRTELMDQFNLPHTITPKEGDGEDDEDDFQDIFGNFHVKQKKANKKRRQAKKKKYAGGLVRAPRAALYSHPWERIFVWDFGSLYPSIVDGEDICYSAVVNDRRMVDDPRFRIKWVPIDDYESVGFVTEVQDKKGNWHKIRTVFPKMEAELVSERKRIKKLMKVEGQKVKEILEKLGKPKNTKKYHLTEWLKTLGTAMEDGNVEVVRALVIECMKHMDLEENYNGQQLGAKVAQNAAYGFMGVEEHARLALHVCMAAVTFFGRWMNLLSGWYVVRYYKGCIIYGDTDSIMGQIPWSIVEKLPRLEDEDEQTWMNRCYMKTAADIEGELTLLFKPPHVMELENMSWPMLQTTAKKNYSYGCWTNPQVMDYIKISGIGCVKRDKCMRARKVAEKVDHMVIELKPDKEITKYLQSELDRFVANDLSYEDAEVSCSLKELSEYGSEDYAQVKVAKKIFARSGKMMSAGDRVSIVILDGVSKNLADRAEDMSYAKQMKLPLDLDHYLDQLESILDRVLEHSPGIPYKKMMAKTRSRARHAREMSNPNSLVAMFSQPVKKKRKVEN